MVNNILEIIREFAKCGRLYQIRRKFYTTPPLLTES